MVIRTGGLSRAARPRARQSINPANEGPLPRDLSKIEGVRALMCSDDIGKRVRTFLARQVAAAVA